MHLRVRNLHINNTLECNLTTSLPQNSLKMPFPTKSYIYIWMQIIVLKKINPKYWILSRLTKSASVVRKGNISKSQQLYTKLIHLFLTMDISAKPGQEYNKHACYDVNNNLSSLPELKLSIRTHATKIGFVIRKNSIDLLAANEVMDFEVVISHESL